MRSPSPKVLINRADIYIAPRGRDADGGVLFSFSGSPTYQNIACSAQAQSYTQVIDQDRITQITEWKILFGQVLNVTDNDKIVFTDGFGVSHTAYVDNARDEAGRGSTFTIRAEERT